ncbi:MAG: ribonuclease J [Spirochaetota bacterium]
MDDAASRIRIVPLGGLKEIGKNMLVIEYNDDVIVIDAGLMFPKNDMFGVDYVIPDISYLRDKKILALILTHGHEDHIGAVAHIIETLDAPVYGTRLTLAFLREKLMDAHIDLEKMKFTEVHPRDVITLSNLEIEFIHVNHSIVDSVALAIKTPLGTIIHTGDFKIDLEPIDGKPIDLYKFAEYGERGVLLLLSDSTNVENSGFTRSESIVNKELEHFLAINSGMIIVATFASSIHRIQQLVSAAHKNSKFVTFSGRSLLRYTEIARSLGHLHFPDSTVIPIEDISKYPREKVICITTGSQGEPYSSLSLIAQDAHRHVKIRSGDVVLLSARIIPGNEVSVNSLVNHLYGKGAVVIDEDDYHIHSSGHASSEELKLIYRLVKPRYFVPIHGENRHLIRHVRTIEPLADKRESIFLMFNGDVLEITPNGAAVIDNLDLINVYVDGKGVGDISELVIKDRQKLAANGVVFVSASINKENNSVSVNADIVSRGFIFYDGKTNALVEKGKDIVVETIENLVKKGKVKSSILQYETKYMLQRFFFKEIERQPLVVVTINESKFSE